MDYKKILFRSLFYLQLHRLMHYLNRKKIIILSYHGFTDKKAHKGIENYQGKHFNIEAFRAQMAYLKKYYNLISLEQLFEYYTNNKTIPDNSVVITIDDGYESNYTLAYPILKEYDIPATIFLASDFIERKEPLWVDRIENAINRTKAANLKLKIMGRTLSFDLSCENSKRASEKRIRAIIKSLPQEKRAELIESLEDTLGQKLRINNDTPAIYRPLQWHQIQEMIKSGIISIGSHTCTHLVLTKCNPQRLENELSLSKRLIEQKTGRHCGLFCYPNGIRGTFSRLTKDFLKKAGYLCAITNVEGINNGYSDIFELKRFGVKNKDDMITFIVTLSGISYFFRKIKKALANEQ